MLSKDFFREFSKRLLPRSVGFEMIFVRHLFARIEDFFMLQRGDQGARDKMSRFTRRDFLDDAELLGR